MAIQPFTFTQPVAYSGGIDWSPLEKIGETIAKAQQEAEAARLIKQLDMRLQQPQQQAADVGTTQATPQQQPRSAAPLWLQSAAQGNYSPAGPPAAAAAAATAAAPFPAVAPSAALSPDAAPPWLQSALAGNYSPAAPKPAVDPRSPVGRILARLGMGASPDSMPAPFPVAGAAPVPGLPSETAVAQGAPAPPPLAPFPEGGAPPVVATPERPVVLPPWVRNALVGGGGSAGLPTLPAPPAQGLAGAADFENQPAPAAARSLMDAFAQAPPVSYSQAGLDRALGVIRQKESSGNYGNVTTTRNPRTGQTQSALGAYGVMDFNVGPWTKEALGRELSPDEFLRSREAQDAVARYKFGQYADKYGLSGAARAWLGGPGNMNKNVPDAFGTTPLAYGADFERKMGGLPPEITTGASRPQAMAFDATAAAPQAAAAPTQATGGATAQRAIQNLSAPQMSAATANISSDELAALYRNPVTRPLATAFLQKKLDPDRYGFTSVEGNLIRYDKTHGSVSVIPIPGKPIVVGKNLYDPATKQWIKKDDEAYPDEPSTGFRWVDPKDKSKGEIAIEGGPGTQLPAEVAAKIGLGKTFLSNLPSIKQRLDSDLLGIDVNPTGHLAAVAGVGAGAETKRQIESGADALLRMLTGAGMGIQEATDYAMRYRPTARDTKDQLLSKMAQLEQEIHSTSEVIGRGRGGSPLGNMKRTFGDQTQAAPAAGGVSPGTALQLEVGKAYYGRRYLGGPPGDPKSWGARVQ